MKPVIETAVMNNKTKEMMLTKLLTLSMESSDTVVVRSLSSLINLEIGSIILAFSEWYNWECRSSLANVKSGSAFTV